MTPPQDFHEGCHDADWDGQDRSTSQAINVQPSTAQQKPYTGPERRSSGWDGVEQRKHPPTPLHRVAEVRLTDETIEYLEQKIAQAVRDGIAGAITEDTAAKFWGAGLTVLQKQATAQTGKLVLSGLSGLVSKGFLFLLAGGLVYAVGGWSALAGLFKALFHSGG